MLAYPFQLQLFQEGFPEDLGVCLGIFDWSVFVGQILVLD